MVGAADTVLASASPRRKALIVSSPQANRLTVSFGQQAAVLDVGCTLHPGGSPVHFTDANFPGGLTQEVRGIMAVAGETIGVMEFMELS